METNANFALYAVTEVHAGSIGIAWCLPSGDYHEADPFWKCRSVVQVPRYGSPEYLAMQAQISRLPQMK